MTEAVLDEQWTDGRFARYFNTGSPSGLGLNTPVVNSIIGKFNRGDRTHVANLVTAVLNRATKSSRSRPVSEHGQSDCPK